MATSDYCENCGGKWGDAVKVVDGLELCQDCIDAGSMPM